MSEQDQSASPLPRRGVIAIVATIVVVVILGVIGVLVWQPMHSDGVQGEGQPATASLGDWVADLTDKAGQSSDNTFGDNTRGDSASGASAMSEQGPAGEVAVDDAAAADPVAAPAAPGAELLPPSFDIVRVSPDGRAVIAGKAAPGAQVTVSAGEKRIGTVTADDRGDWVLVPDAPIPAGDQILSLQAKSGSTGAISSSQSAIISIPDRPDEEVLVAITEPNAPTRKLAQGATGELAQLPAGKPFISVAAIDLVLAGDKAGAGAGAGDAADAAMAIFSGRAPAASRVNLYLDDQFIGTTTANNSGVWLLRSAIAVPLGAHHLRVDQTGPAGKVVLRAQVKFVRQAAGSLSISGQQVHILRGNYLWQIARNLFGAGHAYSYIYNENRDQIRDPDLIYPGQIFAIPVTEQADRAR